MRLKAFHPNYIPQCFFIDGSRGKYCSFTFFNAGEVELVLLCNYFIYLLIFFISCCQLSGGLAGAFFHSWKNGTLVLLLLYGALSLFHHTELEPVPADGGFRLWFGWGLGEEVMWREEMNSIPWAFPLASSHLFTGSTEKREASGQKNAVCSALISTVFPSDWVLGRARVFREELLCFGWGLTPVWFGRRCSSWNQEVSWSHPSGFTVCRQAVALAATASSLLHHYVSKEINSLFCFCLLLSKKMEPNFEWMFLCFWAIEKGFLYILSLLS